MIALVPATAVGAVSAAPKAPVAEANATEAQLPAKAKVAAHFSGIALNFLARR